MKRLVLVGASFLTAMTFNAVTSHAGLLVPKSSEQTISQEQEPQPELPPSSAESSLQDRMDFANGLYQRDMLDMALSEYDKIVESHPADPQAVAAHFRAAECLFLLKRYDDASVRYEDFLKKFPQAKEIPTVRQRIGESLYHQKRPEEALKQFEPLYSSDDIRARSAARYFSGKIAYDQNDVPAAKNHFIEVLGPEDQNTFRPYANFYMGEIAVLERNYPDAIPFYETAMAEGDPQVSEIARFGLAKVYLYLRRFEEAKEFFQTLTETSSNASLADDAYLNYLNALFHSGDHEAVFRSVEARGRKLEDPHKRLRSLFLAAETYDRVGQYPKALAVYTEVLSDASLSVQMREQAQLGRIQSILNSGDAETALKEAEALEGTDFNVKDRLFLLKATALNRLGRSADALAALETLTRDYPETEYGDEALLNRAYLYLEQDKLPDAEKVFRDFLERYSDHPLAEKAMNDLILVDIQANRPEQAVEDSHAFLKRFTKSERLAEVHERLASLYMDLKDYASAVTFYQDYLERFKPDPAAEQKVLYLIGYNKQLTEKFHEAIEYYSRVRKGIADPEVYFSMLKNRAYSFVRLGDLDAAAIDYAEIITAFPQNDLNAEVFFWLANRYLEKVETGNMHRLILYLNSRTDAEAHRAEIEYYEAESFRLEENYAQAVIHYQKCIDQKGPFLGDALYGKGRAHVGQKEWDLARQSLIDALKYTGEDYKLAIRIRTEMAQVQYLKGDYAEAAKAYMAVAILYDDPEQVPWALWNAAEAFEKAGQQKKALQVHQELIERFGEHPLAQRSDERLKAASS